jgi:site-specific DNA-methyltransferase (adenine-specific)
MNNRKQAHRRGLSLLSRQRELLIPSDNHGRARAPAYNARQMNLINGIHQGDCVKLLNEQPEGWLDLVFADPPFNIGYLYHNYDDQKDVAEYVGWSETWMRAVHRALKPNGSFYLAIGDEFAADLCVAARRKIGFHLRNWIIWHYTFGQQTKKMFAKSHTHILYFTKDEKEFTFNADSVRVASARQTTYADARANPKGKLPDDTWFLRPQEAAPHGYFESGSDTWNESRVCGTFREREGWHGCQMPIGVLNRIILASSNPGDVVLDPFNGSGTTVVSAALLGRKYVGIDQSEEYVGFARKRLEHALESTQQESASAIADPTRASRVMTVTDAFGRPRVKRQRNGKAMKDSRRIMEPN